MKRNLCFSLFSAFLVYIVAAVGVYMHAWCFFGSGLYLRCTELQKLNHVLLIHLL